MSLNAFETSFASWVTDALLLLDKDDSVVDTIIQRYLKAIEYVLDRKYIDSLIRSCLNKNDTEIMQASDAILNRLVRNKKRI